ncbi:MAG: M14 family zinc carboxypeptidase, partial [Thermoanaerobaculia bacterium]
MNRTRSAATFWALLALTSPLYAQSAGEERSPGALLEALGGGPWVVRIDFGDRRVADALYQRIDVWRIFHDQGVLEAAVSPQEYRQLQSEGFRLEIDEAKTAQLTRLGIPLKAQLAGIPGFPCYRTVEETYATATAIVAAHPDLASWTDIGDSWEKTQDPGSGWDLFVLKLTQSAVPGPKPSFFAHFAIHAREYTTAELGTRFAEMLVDGYGVDPDITWLLDHHQI